MIKVPDDTADPIKDRQPGFTVWWQWWWCSWCKIIRHHWWTWCMPRLKKPKVLTKAECSCWWWLWIIAEEACHRVCWWLAEAWRRWYRVSSATKWEGRAEVQWFGSTNDVMMNAMMMWRCCETEWCGSQKWWIGEGLMSYAQWISSYERRWIVHLWRCHLLQKWYVHVDACCSCTGAQQWTQTHNVGLGGSQLCTDLLIVNPRFLKVVDEVTAGTVWTETNCVKCTT